MPQKFSYDRKSSNPIQWAVDYDIDSLCYRILAYRNAHDNGTVFETIEKKYNPGERIIPTFAFTHREEMQPLMNALWELGVRPNAYTITNEHFNTVKEHLADMKVLVEKAYKLEFPKASK